MQIDGIPSCNVTLLANIALSGKLYLLKTVIFHSLLYVYQDVIDSNYTVYIDAMSYNVQFILYSRLILDSSYTYDNIMYVCYI